MTEALSQAAPRPLVRIEATKGLALPPFRELWSYRELLYFLVWRDVKVRYKQTALGAVWAVLQPLALMIVFSVFLGKLAKVPSGGVPYPLLVYTALVPWTLFAQSLAGSAESMLRNANLVAKIYFPRILLPISSAGSYVVDFLVSGALLAAMMAWYARSPHWSALWLPAFAVLALAAAFAVGIWLAALNVRFRDVRYAVPLLTQVWLFASPIAYPSSIVPHRYRSLYALNPMAGVVDGFRWALLGNVAAPGWRIAVSTGAVIVLFVGGLLYFRRVERTFADVI